MQQEITLIIITTAIAVVMITTYLFIVKNNVKNSIIQAKQNTKTFLAEAESEAKELKYKAIQDIEKQHETLNKRRDNLSDRKDDIQAKEIQLKEKEFKLNQRDNILDSLDKNLSEKEEDLNEKLQVTLEKELKIDRHLNEISSYTKEQARQIVFDQAKKTIRKDIGKYLKRKEEEAINEAQSKAINLMVDALPKYAQDVASEKTTSTIKIPSDEVKGKMIGREGRNIRAFEAATGVDLLIDDSPNIVTVSCFDPVRREVAKRAMEKLLSDGRIQPSSIEEQVERAKKSMEDEFFLIAKDVIYELGIHDIPREIRKYIGILKFRTSYGQNALKHSVEVAHLSGLMAAEIGENIQLAKRSGLLHDIGKALDFEHEGTHVELGAKLCEKHNEHKFVINGIETHHGDKEPIGLIPILVTAADTLSASRPGARRQSLEQYLDRLKNLEKIAKEFKEVDQAFAIKAGREIRVMVKPNIADDEKCAIIARDIKIKIEETMTYPGNIFVNVIRETRHSEVAQ